MDVSVEPIKIRRIMVANQNQQFVLNWLETLESGGDPFAALADDVTFIIPGPVSNPIFGTFKGKEKISQFFTELGKKVEQQKFTVTSCLTEGNTVVVFLDEQIFPKKNPHQKYLNRTAWLFKLNDHPRDKKILYLYCYDDTAITAEALG